MENIPVIMILEDLTQLPKYQLPEGFYFRNFRDGDEKIWAEVETAAGEFLDAEKGVKQFEMEFGKYRKELQERLIILENDQNRCIGTAMGWFDDSFFREGYGRMHWVGIHPEYQGKGLARPLVAEAMKIIKKRHTKAYLTTQTTSYKAIKIYLDFGFQPFITDDNGKKAWKILADYLAHPLLDVYK